MIGGTFVIDSGGWRGGDWMRHLAHISVAQEEAQARGRANLEPPRPASTVLPLPATPYV